MGSPELLVGGPADAGRLLPWTRHGGGSGRRAVPLTMIVAAALAAWTVRGLVEPAAPARPVPASLVATAPLPADAARDPGFAVVVRNGSGVWRAEPGIARGPFGMPSVAASVAVAGRYVVGSDGSHLLLTGSDLRGETARLGPALRVLAAEDDVAWVVAAAGGAGNSRGGDVVRGVALPSGRVVEEVPVPAGWEVQDVLPAPDGAGLVVTRPSAAVADRRVVQIALAFAWADEPFVAGTGVYLGAGQGRFAWLTRPCGADSCGLAVTGQYAYQPVTRTLAPPAGWTFAPGPVAFTARGVVAFTSRPSATAPLALAYATSGDDRARVVPGSVGAGPAYGIVPAPGGVLFGVSTAESPPDLAYWAIADAGGARVLDRFVPPGAHVVCACG